MLAFPRRYRHGHRPQPSRRSAAWFSARLGAVVLIALFLSLLAPFANRADARDLHWERFDVDIELHDDGSFTVTERQEIAFTDGSFSEGFAVIPLDRVESIENVRVAGDGVPYERGYGRPGTYSVTTIGGEIEILWWFEPAEDEIREFTISYDVIGGLRVYTNEETGQPRDQLWWRVIDTEFAADVRNTEVRVHLPQDVAEEDLTARWETIGDVQADVRIVDPRQIAFSAGNLRQGNALEVRLEFPKITSAVAPSWQERDDAQRAKAERLDRYGAVADVIMLAAGLLLAVGGTVGVVALWYTRGRDTPVALPIDLLREPPDDLPAAAVGVLIDEQAHDHDVIAAIIEFGERGIIDIREEGGTSRKAKDFHLRRIAPSEGEPHPEFAEWEEELLRAFFGPSLAGEVKLSDIKIRFTQRQQTIKDALYDELAKRGYFTSNPRRTRTRYRTAGSIVLVLGMLWFFGGIGLVASFAPLVVVPGLALGLIGVLLMAVAGSMPKKTQLGAESAARWLAFRRYLEEIERYDSVEQARTVANAYLPYAVAFGLERAWVRKFSSVGAPAPEWYGTGGDWPMPRRYRRSYRPYRTTRPMGGGTVGLPDFDMPDIPGPQQMSDSLGRSLQDVSGGLFGLFNDAASAFNTYPPPPKTSSVSRTSRGWSGGFGGGFSGGGRSFGGGGGGGSRGFR